MPEDGQRGPGRGGAGDRGRPGAGQARQHAGGDSPPGDGQDDAGTKAAGLPAGKTFASWREADSSIPLPAQHALATLEWVTRAENLCIAGPSVIPGTPTRPHLCLRR